MQWAESVLHDPIFAASERSCGTAEGVQIAERESKRDGQSLLFEINTFENPWQKALHWVEAWVCFYRFIPQCTNAGGCYTQSVLSAVGSRGGQPRPPWLIQSEPPVLQEEPVKRLTRGKRMGGGNGDVICTLGGF